MIVEQEVKPFVELSPIQRLTKDLKKASATLSIPEARYLVDTYYSMQDYRKTAANQSLALRNSGEPGAVINWLEEQTTNLENQIKRALDAWTEQQPVGLWCKSITGIGPVIAAGLLAHIDINKAPTLGHILAFAGMDPSRSWLGAEGGKKLAREAFQKTTDPMEALAYASQVSKFNIETLNKMAGTKFDGTPQVITEETLAKALARRPWNASLKTLLWKLGQSFVKFSNNPNDHYGRLYRMRKMYEIDKNDKGEWAYRAIEKLEKFKIGKSSDAWPWYAGCYPAGTSIACNALESEKRAAYLKSVRVEPGKGVQMLPPAHIQARSEKWAVKIFLSHFHHVSYHLILKRPPPKPYVIDYLGHNDFFVPPNFTDPKY